MSEGAATPLEAWLASREPRPPEELGERLRRRAREHARAGSPGAAVLPPAPLGAGARATHLAILAVRLLGELASEPGGPGSKALAAAGPGGAEARAGLRARAARLLEADALLTYAFEAAAERGPEAVEALAAWLAPARLAALLLPAPA